MQSYEIRKNTITSKGQVKSFYEGGIHVGGGETYSFYTLEGVSLTIEWFKAFGFEIDDSVLEHKSIVITRLINPETFLYNGRELKYVHQLQNLYLGIVGEELELLDTTLIPQSIKLVKGLQVKIKNEPEYYGDVAGKTFTIGDICEFGQKTGYVLKNEYDVLMVDSIFLIEDFDYVVGFENYFIRN